MKHDLDTSNLPDWAVEKIQIKLSDHKFWSVKIGGYLGMGKSLENAFCYARDRFIRVFTDRVRVVPGYNNAHDVAIMRVSNLNRRLLVRGQIVQWYRWPDGVDFPMKSGTIEVQRTGRYLICEHPGYDPQIEWAERDHGPV